MKGFFSFIVIGGRLCRSAGVLINAGHYFREPFLAPNSNTFHDPSSFLDVAAYDISWWKCLSFLMFQGVVGHSLRIQAPLRR